MWSRLCHTDESAGLGCIRTCGRFPAIAHRLQGLQGQVQGRQAHRRLECGERHKYRRGRMGQPAPGGVYKGKGREMPELRFIQLHRCPQVQPDVQDIRGVTEDSKAEIYLRPETAQGIFVNFKNVLRTTRKKIPFGIGQIGKSFRNEITPGTLFSRTREFEQMELEFSASRVRTLNGLRTGRTSATSGSSITACQRKT